MANKPPVEKFNHGHVHVAIWENTGIKGAFRVASFELQYQDEQRAWQKSKSYGASDLKDLESAATEARARIEKWTSEQKSGTALDPA